jgi:putative ABC transport system permease protein
VLGQDVRYAIRQLWQSKGFTVVAALCLGLGIGLNTTIFSIVDGVLLKPFPYAEPDRLMPVMAVNDRLGVTGSGLSYADLRDFRAATSQFVSFGASQGRSLTVSDGGEPERYSGAIVSWDLFPTLGLAPVAGRGFSADDDRPGASGVVILSYAVWSHRYQNDPTAIGRGILINGVPTTIIGVMPPRFEFPENQKLWLPMAPLLDGSPRANRGLNVFARLRPGASREQADAELAAVASKLAAEFPGTNENWTARTETLRERLLPTEVTLVIWLMMAAVTLVLFIACSNVANLLLARASARRREIAVRASLGAGRGRIVRQLLTESVVLSLAAVPLGVLVAEIGTRLIAADMPVDQVPYYITWTVDARSLAYTVVVAVGTAVIFGLFPALQASRGNLHESLKEGTRGNSARRSLMRSALVVVQIALALVALVGAMLFVRTFSNLNGYDVGFDTGPLMTMRFYLAGVPYEAADAKARRVEDIVGRIERLPGVEAAFASNMVPLSGGGGGGTVAIDGRPSEPGKEPSIDFVGVTPHLLKTLGVKVASGRDFTDAEGWSRTPVAIINKTMASRFWPDADPVGSRFQMVCCFQPEDWFTVIGVVPDIKRDGIDPEDRPRLGAFVPYAYQQSLNTGLTIRVAGRPTSVTGPAREQIRAADPNLPVFAVQTMDDLRRLGYWEYGLFGWVFGSIGVMGLVLAAIGVYGVLAYAVSQRTQEIGVRMALGASRRTILALIVGDGLGLAGIGIVAGLVLAPAGTWLGRSLFYDVSPFDPASFAGVAAFLALVAFLASYVPARRATRVDPVVALRGE